MNQQHVPYYHNGQLNEVPRHQIQHAVVPPGVPMVMSQQHAFVPYGIPLQRHTRPVYHSSPQASGHMMRHPAAVVTMPIPISQHHPPVVEGVRVRYSVNQPMAMAYQSVRAEVPVVKPPALAVSAPPVVAEYAPLDLSAKAKTVKSSPVDVKPIAQAAIVQYADQPLDLSKPLKAKGSPGFSQSSNVMNMTNDKRNTSLSVQKSPSARLVGEQSGRLSTSSTATTDIEQELAASQAFTSNSSLIGNHPLDDILYLHCARCQSSYGSIHAFRKHFRNTHGYMPNSEDVLIQSIKATKEYVMNKNDHQSPSAPPKRHCVFCGWQCEQTTPSVFSKHMQEHYDGKGCFYRCIYCQQDFADPNTLRQHVVQHSAVYQYICAVCCLAFPTEDQLSAHMLSQHEVRYTSRKVNLPVSVVLPSMPAMTPVRHETSPKVPNPYLLPKMKPGYPSMYPDHMQPKLPVASPRAQSLATPNNYAHPSMQAKSAMLISPRYDPAKVTSPSSAAYKKPFLSSPSTMPIPAAPEPGKSGNQSAAPFDLMSLLNKVVEQGLKCNETRASTATTTTSTTRRVPQSLPIPSYDNGNRQSYNPLTPSTQSLTSHSATLVDFSRHSNVPPAPTAPLVFDTSNAKQYTTTMTSSVDTIDLSMRNNRYNSAQYNLQSCIASSLINYSQKQVHAYGCQSTASSSFLTHSTFAPNQSLKENTNSDHQKPAPATSKPAPTPTTPLKTPLVDITGPDSAEEAADQSAIDASAGSKVTAASTASTQPPSSSVNTKLVKQEKLESSEQSTDSEANVASSLADVNGVSDYLNQAEAKERKQKFSELENKPAVSTTDSNQSQSDVDSKNGTKSDCQLSNIKQEVQSSPNTPQMQGSFANNDGNEHSVKSEVCETDESARSKKEASNTSCMGGLSGEIPNMISSIIDRAVKSHLPLEEVQASISSSTAISSSSTTETVNSKPVSSSKGSTGTVTRSSTCGKKCGTTDAIPVTWAELKHSEQSLEVDRIQAMSACRVLLNPHSFPIKSYANAATSLGKDDNISTSVGSHNTTAPARCVAKKRSVDNSYSMAENGALDMSKKCNVNNSCQDQSDSSACSSPKRLRIVENE